MRTRFLFALAAMLAAESAADAQSLVLERVDIRGLPRVLVDLAVKDARGEDLAGVLSTDFEVRIDGVPASDIQITSGGEGEDQAPAVFLLVDRSGEMPPAIVHSLRRAAGLVLEGLPAGTPVAVYSFDEGVRQELPLSDDRALARQAITAISPGRGTSYEGPLNVVSGHAAAVEGRRSVMIYVIASSHYPAAPPAPGQAYSLKGQATPIYPVVIREDAPFALEDTVARVVRRIARGLPGRYRLALATPFASDGQIHALSVTLRATPPAAAPPSATCRFRAVRGIGVTPSPLIESEGREQRVGPIRRFVVGTMLGALGLTLLSMLPGMRRVYRPRLIGRIGILGVGAALGALLALAALG